jgi:DHA1 family bicyclomycin/chloramphenicol resistance-like MFS transporter
MSRLLLVIGVAPLFAPSIGGFIARYVTWRGVFVALALFGACLFVAVLIWLPESLEPERRSRDLRQTWRGYGTLARDRHFLALAVIPGLNSAVLMSYVIGSPFVFQSGFGFSSFQFSMLFAVNGCGLVIGAQIAAALVKHHSPAHILRVSIPTMALLAGWLFTVSRMGWGGLPLLIGSLFLTVFTINFSPPNASALAMARHGQRAGTAAAFIGGVQFGLSGLISPLVGLLGADATAMSTVMFGAGLCAVLTLALGTPIYRRGGAQKLDTAGLR